MSSKTGPRVVVECVGEGRGALVFVHGAACDRHDWDAQRRALAEHFRIVAIDLPGHGESELPADATVAELARAVRRATDEHCAGGAMLIGHSLGCRVVLEAYSQAPARIRGLVFVDANPLAAPGDAAAAEAMSARLDELGTTRYLRQVFERMFVPQSGAALRGRVVERTARWNGEFARAVLLDLCRWDAQRLVPALAQIAVPVLLIQSTCRGPDGARRSLLPDMTTPWTECVRQIVRDARLRIVPGVGHFPQLEAPAAVSAHIAEFARECFAAR